MLSKLNIAGQNGQFRTPPHIRRLMVDLVEPKPDWTIGDPACGTAGFLVAVMEYLQETYTSPQGILTEERDGETFQVYTGDLLEPYRAHIRSGMFHGYDFDVTMLRIAAMNLMLHGVDNPHIDYMDTLSERFVKERPKEAKDAFDLILANPPVQGEPRRGVRRRLAPSPHQDPQDRAALPDAHAADAQARRPVCGDRARRRAVRLVDGSRGPAEDPGRGQPA